MGLAQIFKFSDRQQLERRGPRRPGQKRPPDHRGRSRRLARHGAVPAIVILVVLAAAAFCIAYRTPQRRYELLANQPAPEMVVAYTDFRYRDLAETDRRRGDAADRVPRIWYRDSTVTEGVLRAGERFLAALDGGGVPPAPDTPPAPGADPASLWDSLGPGQQQYLRELLNRDDKRRYLLDSLREVMIAGVVDAEARSHYGPHDQVVVRDAEERNVPTDFTALATPAEAAERLESRFFDRYALSPNLSMVDLLETVAAELIAPNLRYDDAATEAARRQARAAVEPVERLVSRGTVFIPAGARIDAQYGEMLAQHNRALERASRDSRQFAVGILAQLLLALLVILAGAGYLATVHPKVLRNPRQTMLIGLTIALNLLLVWITNEAFLYFGRPQPLVYSAMPLALTPILLTLLLGSSVGMSSGLMLCLLCVVIGGDPMRMFWLGAVQAVVGALAVRSARTRVQTFRAWAYVPPAIILVEGVFLFTWHLNQLLAETPVESQAPGPSLYVYYLIVVAMAYANVLATLILVNLLLPLCEWLFGLTTNISLLELSDLNHPLLKRLNLEAPGTYHHTMQVATLAEHAAERIGANTLLARVASYFHDIGKLASPHYFTENSFGEDRHEELNPRMSNMIIQNHVKEGLGLARKYKLRRPIIEAIESHHGTSLVYYFYHRAREHEQLDRNGEGDYRYAGPRPHSREAAIISICDACEAASRSLAKPSPAKIDGMVDEIVRKKMLDGQLDDSDLTLRDIHEVVQSIKFTLRNMLHGRIAYPREGSATVRIRPDRADDGEETIELRSPGQATTVEMTANDNPQGPRP